MTDPTTTDRRRIDPIRLPRTPRPSSAPYRVDARLLRRALGAGRLRLGTLRLTILQALAAELRRRGLPAPSRRARRERAERFLASHADRRSVPGAAEARRWTEAAKGPAAEGPASEGEVRLRREALRLLYVRVLGRDDPWSAVS